jgi:hypothetical protein
MLFDNIRWSTTPLPLTALSGMYGKEHRQSFGPLTGDRWNDTSFSVPSKASTKTPQSSAYKCTGRGVGLLVGNGSLVHP